jgi:hypothetical protein
MVIQIRTEKYTNPCRPCGYGWMAHSDDIEVAGVFGFGDTEQEAVDAFGRELERVKIDA